MTAKKRIEGETIVLEAVAIAQVTTNLIVIRVVMTVSLHHSTGSITWCKTTKVHVMVGQTLVSYMLNLGETNCIVVSYA